MGIRRRLLAAMVALSTIGVFVASWVAYQNAETNLRNAAVRQLAGVSRSRAYQIESYFQTVWNHVQSLSDDRMFVDAMREFSDAYKKLDATPHDETIHKRVNDHYERVYLPRVRKFMPLGKQASDYFPVGEAGYWLQDRYVVQPAEIDSEVKGLGKGYVRAHAKYDPAFRLITRRFDYYDLILIELRDLRVIYSVAKNPDFGTSLLFGPYKDTALARVVKQAVSTSNPEAVFVSDFTRYEPAKGAPAAFIASPIFDGQKRVGIFVMQISTAEIDRVVSGNRGWEKDGLGKTGDIEIVGRDHLMRSTSRDFLEHPSGALENLRRHGVTEQDFQRVRTYGTTILSSRVSLSSVDKALAGQKSTTVETDSDGQEILSAYMPIDVPGGVDWMLLARIDLDEALAPIHELRRAAILWGLVAILATIAVALILTEQILRPIKSLLAAAEQVSSGDLSARVEVRSQDELGALSAAFNRMSDSVQQSMKVIEHKNRENENLLLNILPGPVAQRLKSGETVIADSYAEATVLFADIVGFTNLSSKQAPNEIVSLLNGLFTQFDAAAKRHGIEKVKTIGDAYMAVAGMPVPDRDHAKRMVEMALDMLEVVKSYALDLGMPLAIRIGLNAGPVAAGVVGTTKFIYDLWGDTVNMASRMESTGMPGSIQVSKSVYEALKDDYNFEARGSIEIKGKGLCETWLLHSRVASANLEPLTSIT